MTRPFTLQQRLRTVILVPAVAGALALGGLAIVQFGDGSPLIGILAAAAAAVLVTLGFLGASRTTQDVQAALEDTIARGRAIETGVAPSPSPAANMEDLRPLNAVLEDIHEQHRVVRAQSEAIAAGALDSPILDTPTPGPFGPAIRGSIDGLRSTTDQLRDAEAVKASIMDHVSDAIVVVDANDEIVASNAVAKVALDLFGGSMDDAIPGWKDLTIGEHDFSRTLTDGSLTLTQVSTSRMMTSSGAVTMLCWRDVSGERAVQAQVAHVARTDIVTGLPNRQGVLAAHDRLHDLSRSASVIHIDLADFSQINQRHGFKEGDRVLQTISKRLTEVIRTSDTVARVSGDEFILLLESQGDNVDGLARRILDRIAEPIELENGATISLAAHAGWSTGEVDGEYELLRRANYALAEAKDDPDSVSSYSAEVAQRDENRREWEQQLRRAIANDEFVLYAQPIVDIFERRVLGVEVFLRWQHPSGRLISPGDFIAIAEESELIVDIDRWVIAKTIEQAAASDPSIVFSLNVSTRFMASPLMTKFVTTTLATHGVPAGRIQIDVTETNVAADVRGVIESIRSLNEVGIKVALDDFGTGYSSLAHLLKLAVSTIKIDRRMVSMVNEPEGRGVVAAILAFAKKRKLTVVAEGVESEEEVAALADLGCRFQQGYYHGHPADLVEMLDSLDSIPFQTLDEGADDDEDDADGAAAATAAAAASGPASASVAEQPGTPATASA